MKSIARELVKLAKSLVASEEELARNLSFWSWDYDSNTVTAKVLMDTSNGSLRLTIEESHTKSGLGAGTRTAILEDVDLGTVWKPKVSLAIGLLKKRSHERSRAGSPFKRLWKVAPHFSDEASLGDIISWKAKAMAPAAAPVHDVEDDRIKLLKMVRSMDPAGVAALLQTVERM